MLNTCNALELYKPVCNRLEGIIAMGRNEIVRRYVFWVSTPCACLWSGFDVVSINKCLKRERKRVVDTTVDYTCTKYTPYIRIQTFEFSIGTVYKERGGRFVGGKMDTQVLGIALRT